MKKIIIGTRGSTLALIQAKGVLKALQQVCPHLTFEIKVIKTTGDMVTHIPLEKIGDKGLFIKELEKALLEKEIDLAVHSMKDLPTTLPEGLAIGAVLPREEPWDALICREERLTLEEIAPGFVVGSGSLRRRAQVLHHFPNMLLEPIRGNLDTRLQKLRRGAYDAIILALAGIKRMGWQGLVSQVIPAEISLPAVGQGAVGVEVRAGDEIIMSAAGKIDCHTTAAEVRAERAFLRHLEGGCQVPVAAYASRDGDRLNLEGMVASLDGRQHFRRRAAGSFSDPEELGVELAELLLGDGCGGILERIRGECGQG